MWAKRQEIPELEKVPRSAERNRPNHSGASESDMGARKEADAEISGGREEMRRESKANLRFLAWMIALH